MIPMATDSIRLFNKTIAGIMSLVPQKFRFGGSDKHDE
jgi:hypothetical protein